MPNQEHLSLLKQGVEVWGEWRLKNQSITPNLIGANLNGINLQGANMCGANLYRANLQEANLSHANLNEANLKEANLSRANLNEANLSQANLSETNLKEANLREANLRGANLNGANFNCVNLNGANLSGANLSKANLKKASLNGANLNEANLTKVELNGADLTCARFVGTNVEEANFEGCRIYGISTWNFQGCPNNQSNLIITRVGEPEIIIDDFEVAQIVYLLVNHPKILNIIVPVAKKTVLILGKFLKEQLEVLQTIRSQLRQLGYLPIYYDFSHPKPPNYLETVSTLVQLSKFVIVDLTDSEIFREEIAHIAGTVSVPIQPLWMKGVKNIYVNLDEIRANHHSVLNEFYYENPAHLMQYFEEMIILPAENMAVNLLEYQSKYSDKCDSVYFQQGVKRYVSGDVEGAIEDYNQALFSNPSDDRAYRNRGIARAKLGDVQGAMEDYNQALRLNAYDAQAYNNRGIVRYSSGDVEGAMEDYNQALRLNANNAKAYVNRGLAYHGLGDFKRAIEDYNSSLRIEPNDAKTYVNRGLARASAGDKLLAISDLQKADDPVSTRRKHKLSPSNSRQNSTIKINYNRAKK